VVKNLLLTPTIKEVHITENNLDAIINIVMALKPTKLPQKYFKIKIF